MPQRVDRHVQLRAAFALGAVIAGPRPAFRRGAQGAAVDDRRRGLRVAPGGDAQEGTQILRKRFEDPRRQPTLRLLIHGEPRRQIIGHGAPSCAVTQHVAQAVESLAQRGAGVAALLSSISVKIGRNERRSFRRLTSDG